MNAATSKARSRPTPAIIVIGDAPDKGSTEIIKNHGDILRDAERYHVHTMNAQRFQAADGLSEVEFRGAFWHAAPSVDAGKAAAPRRPPPRPPKAAAPKSDDSGT